MGLAELDVAHEEGEDEAEAGDGGVEDPHAAEGEGVGVEDDGALVGGQGANEVALGAGEAAGDGVGVVGAEGGGDAGHLLAQDVLVDDGAEDGGDGGRGLAQEAEGGGRGGDVGGVDVGLQGDEGRLEVGTGADAADDLVDDDARPGGIGLEVDEEAIADGHEEHATDDQLAVAADLAHDEPCRGGDDRQTEHVGQHVHTAEDGAGEEDRLEVEREVVGAGDEDERVAEADEQHEAVVPVSEQPQRDDRVPRDFPLIQHRDHPCDDAEDDETDDRGGGPRITDTAELETEEEHDGAADDEQRAGPVDGADPGEQGRFAGFDLQEEEEDDEGEAADRDWMG